MQCVFGEEMGLGAACYMLYPFYGNILACVPIMHARAQVWRCIIAGRSLAVGQLKENGLYTCALVQ